VNVTNIFMWLRNVYARMADEGLLLITIILSITNWQTADALIISKGVPLRKNLI